MWPELYPNVSFAREPEALNQFFRQMVPNTGSVNRHGGDVTVVHLPEIGIRGNTHFPMSDLNNLQVADHFSQYLAQKRL